MSESSVNDDYAIFIHCDNIHTLPVVTRINSTLYKFFIELEKQYLTGSQIECERLADDIIAEEKGV
jgi:hypothetical protein